MARDLQPSRLRFLSRLSDTVERFRALPESNVSTRHTKSALEKHKREGIELAVRSRWVALAVVAVMLPFLNPAWEMLYYHGLLLALAGVGWLQRRVARVGQSKAELAVLALDLTLMTFILVFPNPFLQGDWPTAMVYRFDNFVYFFVILAAGTLAYSWRTIIAMGNWTVLLWMGALGLVWWFGTRNDTLSDAARTAFPDADMFELLDPNAVNFDGRLQEAVVFMIVAAILAVSVRRFNRLLLTNAALARERENLSRYFSPNVVDELSHNDQPLKEIRSQDVAVLFVDVVGFTRMASQTTPEATIKILRAFHGRMEKQVFEYGGTLDKYLGDGLMATFGTPFAGAEDAANALRCAKAMIQSLAQWNSERHAAGEPEIEARFGLHYGPVVLGDIGSNRLEFAVIGNTVNVSARLEQVTRDMGVQLAMSDQMRKRVVDETNEADPVLAGLSQRPPQVIRGLDQPLPVWTLN